MLKYDSLLCLSGIVLLQPIPLGAIEQEVLSLEVLEGPASIYGSLAWAVSDDGSTIVGMDGQNALIWKNEILASTRPGEVRSVSGDGKVVIGLDDSGSFPTFGFRWENDAASAIEGLPENDFLVPHGTSADGSVIVGVSNKRSPSESQAFRWVNGINTGLGYLDEADTVSEAHDVSADGSVVVGASESSATSSYKAFRWENGVMTNIGPGSARGVSADGTTVVGLNLSADLSSFLWKDGKRKLLRWGRAHKVSNDGSVVVGLDGGSDDSNNSQAVLWAASNAFEISPLDYLVDRSGIDRQGFSLVAAYDINPQGTIIVGRGYYPEIDKMKAYGFKLTLAEPVRSWANFPIEDGRAETGKWLGAVWPKTMEWVWSATLGNWLYVPESTLQSGSGWVYIPK